MLSSTLTGPEEAQVLESARNALGPGSELVVGAHPVTCVDRPVRDGAGLADDKSRDDVSTLRSCRPRSDDDGAGLALLIIEGNITNGFHPAAPTDNTTCVDRQQQLARAHFQSVVRLSRWSTL